MKALSSLVETEASSGYINSKTTRDIIGLIIQDTNVEYFPQEAFKSLVNLYTMKIKMKISVRKINFPQMYKDPQSAVSLDYSIPIYKHNIEF